MNHFSFHALKPSQLTPDAYYKVYVTEEGCYFAKIGGQLSSDEAYDQLPLVLGIVLSFPYKQLQKRQDAREQQFDEWVEEGRPEELLQSSRNFLLQTTEIESVQLSEKRASIRYIAGVDPVLSNL